MASKKQVRRRQKERRHEWEEVYVDEDGNEVEPPSDAESAVAPVRATKRQATRTPARSGGKVIQPPSWQRVLKRSAIFAPLMYITVILLAPDGTTLVEAITQTVFLLLIFIPFSYAMDVMTYRMWRRRSGQADAGGKRP